MAFFPLNAWYAAAYDVEVRQELLARTLCNQKLVLFRRSDGAVSALEDSCWHRLLPLSKGRLENDQVVCGYHGLVYNAQGRCTFMPSQETLNPSACVRSYPVVQKHRFVWVWPGDPALADPGKVPDLHWNDDPQWAGDGKLITVKCDYRLVVDNLMDLTHETFVHGTSIGNSAVAEAPFEVTHGERTAQVTRWMLNIDAPPFWQFQLGKPAKVDRWQYINFEAPAAVVLDVGVALAGTGAPQGDRSQGVTARVCHFITPETERSSHFFWVVRRNFKLNDQRLTTETRDRNAAIIAEDEAVLVPQQIAMEENPDAVFYNLNIDGGAMWARHILERMIAAEAPAASLRAAE